MTHRTHNDGSITMTSVPAATKPVTDLHQVLSRKKRWFFFLLMVMLTYLGVEVISCAALYLVCGGWSVAQMHAEGDAGPDLFDSGNDYPEEVVHPYLGWVRRPHSKSGADGELQVTDYGFVDRDMPLQKRDPDKVIIGILGGSLAEQFATGTTDILKAELQKSSYFSGKELVFVRLALSGYKQPQQLMAVTWLLSLGGKFDILINIDGYNEIVLPVVENAPNHVFDGFPRSWNLRTADSGDLVVMRSIGCIAYLKDRAKFWAELVRASPWCYSPTLNLLWELNRGNVRRKLFQEYSKLYRLKFHEQDYVATGPPQHFADAAELRDHCAQIWMRSSLQLHQLSAAAGIRYFHFLQPNQYVPDSKPMGREDQVQGGQPSHRGKEEVRDGYPLLIREGQNLARQGVSFTDLTALFADHPEQTYKDTCCHLNSRGNELLAQRIAEVIRHDFDPE